MVAMRCRVEDSECMVVCMVGQSPSAPCLDGVLSTEYDAVHLIALQFLGLLAEVGTTAPVSGS